jgi:hypothetical protein
MAGGLFFVEGPSCVRAPSFTYWSGFGSIEPSNCRSTDVAGTASRSAMSPDKVSVLIHTDYPAPTGLTVG